MLQPLLDSNELERMLGVHAGWAAKARLAGDGPVFVRIGRRVAYRPADVDEYLSARTARSTSEAQAA